jgi:hypothetical protein
VVRRVKTYACKNETKISNTVKANPNTKCSSTEELEEAFGVEEEELGRRETEHEQKVAGNHVHCETKELGLPGAK